MDVDYDLVFSMNECRACPLGQQRIDRAAAGQGGCLVPAEVGKEYEAGGLAFLLEAPGAVEDATGRPLVGMAGRLFDQMLADVGVSREEVLIMNKIKCRPPNNNLSRHPEAVANCRQWLEKELETYQPAVIVLMGNTALRDVYGKQTDIGMKRGKPKSKGGVVYLPTYHPAFVRRPNGQRWYKSVLENLELAKELLSAVRSVRRGEREEMAVEVGSGSA